MKRKTFTAFLFTFFILITASKALYAGDTPTTLSVATIEYPPLMGKNGGILTDIAIEAFAEEGIRITYKPMPMVRIFWALTTEKVPAALGTMAWFPEGEKKEKMNPVSVYYSGFHFFYMKERFPNGLIYDRLEELKKYRIGYIRGGSITPLFKKAGIEPEWVKGLTQNAKKCYAGRIDLHAASELAGWEIARKLYPNEIHKFGMVEKPIHEIHGHVIFGENQKQLQETFTLGFRKIVQSGKYLDILKKYYRSRKIPEKTLSIINSVYSQRQNRQTK